MTCRVRSMRNALDAGMVAVSWRDRTVTRRIAYEPGCAHPLIPGAPGADIPADGGGRARPGRAEEPPTVTTRPRGVRGTPAACQYLPVDIYIAIEPRYRRFNAPRPPGDVGL